MLPLIVNLLEFDCFNSILLWCICDSVIGVSRGYCGIAGEVGGLVFSDVVRSAGCHCGGLIAWLNCSIICDLIPYILHL